MALPPQPKIRGRGSLSPLAALPAEDDWRDPQDIPESRSTAGLYVLLKEEEIVYVGISSDIYRRIHEHRLEGAKVFDDWRWLPCGSGSERLRLEALLILAHLPTHNRALTLGLGPSGVWQLPGPASLAPPIHRPEQPSHKRTSARARSSAEAHVAYYNAKRPKRRRRSPL